MVKIKKQVIPVVDIFAGPGGLSEGFSRFSEFMGDPSSFQVKLSIEKEEVAAKTLTLRAFFRQFKKGKVPECYYDFIRGDADALKKIKSLPEWDKAKKHVWNGALGEIPEKELHSRIKTSLEGKKDWVLLGGPPCQAYSLIGRARMSGLGHNVRSQDHEEEDLQKLKTAKEKEFLQDHRHTLYLEYLKIVAVHKPAVFVMENVKGILSSKFPAGKDKNGNPKFKKAFSRIRKDLEKPWNALKGDKSYKKLKSFLDGPECEYNLYSFVKSADDTLFKDIDDRDFIIKSEDYGVPQKRHRVIILGVRKDINQEPEKLQESPQATVRHVIGSMPKLRSGLSKKDDTHENWIQTRIEALPQKTLTSPNLSSVKTEIQTILNSNSNKLERGKPFIKSKGSLSKKVPELKRWIDDEKLGGVIQHETRAHMNSDLGRYLFVSVMGKVKKSSPKLDEWPIELLPAHKNVFDENGKRSKNQSFKDRFRVQLFNEPASTVTAHISKDGHYFIHPDPSQTRSLTMREAARIQTFPDSYYFWGNRTERYHQVGNAVPPYLAVQLAEVVSILLR